MIAIDTTNQIQSVCFKEGGELRGYHGQRPIFSVQDVIAKHPDILKDAEVLLANIGPGQLTATRVGLAFIQGLACSTGISVFAIKQSLLRSAWCYWQKGPGTYEVNYQIDSKHKTSAIFEWTHDNVIIIKDDTLVSCDKQLENHFPVASSAMLMCDLYMWMKERGRLNLLQHPLEPIYMRPAV